MVSSLQLKYNGLLGTKYNGLNATILKSKYDSLLAKISKLGSAIVAFSGGVDSTFLLFAAKQALGKKVLAVTADSESLARSELKEAKSLAKLIGTEHLIIKTNELQNPDYSSNPSNRCYFCKKELFTHLEKISAQKKISSILYGLNSDDLSDFRPGTKAAEEFSVKAPLAEAGLSKVEIRELCLNFSLPISDKPAMPCLSSRIPYGSAVTAKKLSQIENAENFLRTLGFKELRVRHFGEIARIEVAKSEIQKLQGHIGEIYKNFSTLGFERIEVDMAGYQKGNLNRQLKIPIMQ